MFKAIWAARWYMLLGFLVFIFTLIATTPLHFVWQYAEPHARALPVKVKWVSGTLWQGQLQLQAPQVGLLEIDWQLEPLALLMAQADVLLDVSGEGISLQTHAQVSLDQQLSLSETQGELSSALLQPMLRKGRANLSGDFEISGLNAQVDLSSRQIHQAEGRIVFTGGDVGFPVDGKPIQSTLPLLVGDLKREQEKTVLDINTDEGLPIGQAFLQNDGWGGVAIRRRFLDILGQKWPAQATEETVIFEVSQKIL